MRLKRTTQTSLFEPKPVDHPLGRELESISNWLDAHPELLDAVGADLGAQDARGRYGPSCETVLRCAVLKVLRGETWRGLAFARRDSRSASRLLYDGVRVLAGLLVTARQQLGKEAVPCRDRRRTAKRRCLAVRTERGFKEEDMTPSPLDL